MIKFKALKAHGQITYPDPETNETVVLLEHGDYFYCTEKQAKWLSRFPELVEVPGEIILEKVEMGLIEKEEEKIVVKEKSKKKKLID